MSPEITRMVQLGTAASRPYGEPPRLRWCLILVFPGRAITGFNLSRILLILIAPAGPASLRELVHQHVVCQPLPIRN